MTRILVSDSLSQDGLAILEADGAFKVDYEPNITPEELVKRIGDYDAVVVRSRSKITADVLKNARNLKVVGRAGVGLDNVDVNTATKLGIIAMNTPGGNTISTAEHTMSMLLALARSIPKAHHSMQEGRWDKKIFTGIELLGKVLGIIGLGRIGIEVAKRCQSFGMRVIGHDPYISPDVMLKIGVEMLPLEQLVQIADFITVHTPLTSETKGLIGREQFQKMKKVACVINCARGGIIDEAALIEAVEQGTIAGAALDVYEAEPLPPDHPFRKSDRFVLTPHLAASTTEAQHNVAIEIARQVVDVLKGREIRNAVNAPSIDPEILQQLRPYLNLAERIGKFQTQFADSRVTKITAKYSGAVLDYPVAPLTTAVVKGFLEPISDSTVNYVNAMPYAQERGLEVVESKISTQYQYTNLITVEAQMENGKINSVSGTLFAPTTPRIVIINDKHFDATPEGILIVIENNDVPGIIGSVGTLLGEHRINIGQLTWGRTDHSQDAMTVINVDQDVSPEILEKIGKLPNIKSAKMIKI